MSILFLSSLFMGPRDRRKAAEVRRGLTVDLPKPFQTFSPSMVEDLPAPARRYLEHAIAPGTTLGHSLELDFTGHIQFGQSATPLPLSGSNVLIVPSRGFLWPERFVFGGLPRHGVIYYLNDEGEVCWTIGGLIGDPGKRGKGPDTSKSMRTRIMTHLLWTPWAFLPACGARWEAVDETKAKVFVTLDGTELEMEIQVDDSGRLERAIHPRWGAKTKDGSYAFFPFGLTPQGEATFGGYTVPTPLDLAWCYGMEDREPPLLYRYTLTRAVYR